MKIKVPQLLREQYESDYVELFEEVNSFSNRVEILEDIYSKADETLVEQIFTLYTTDFDKVLFREIIEKLWELSKSYCEEHGFVVDDTKKKKPKSDFERDMYIDATGQREMEQVLYSSVVLLPFFTKKNLNKKIGREFWYIISKLTTVDLVDKTEKIVIGRYLSTSDNRFWGLAEQYGLSKEQWLSSTIDILLTRHIIKLDIGKSYAIYAQVIAKDSLNFATKKHFTQSIQVGESNKVINETPDAFINTLILEDELKRFIKMNPDVMNIEVMSSFPPPARYLAVFTLDWYFDISSDIIFKTTSDNYYRDIIKKVTIEILLRNNFNLVADIVKYGNAEKEENPFRVFTLYKNPNDALQQKYVNNMIRYILQNTSSYNRDAMKKQLKVFFETIIK